MRMTRDAGSAGPIITGFAGTGFRVDGVAYPAVLLTVAAATSWAPPAFDLLDEADLAAILTPSPEFVLLGTGPTLRRPPAPLVRLLEARDIGVEAMDSRAAARAWGILRGEGRQIAAALYPLD